MHVVCARSLSLSLPLSVFVRLYGDYIWHFIAAIDAVIIIHVAYIYFGMKAK